MGDEIVFRSQKTIYVKDQELWDSIKAMAGEKSISRYLIDLHEANVFNQQSVREKEDIIQEQIAIVSGIPDVIKKPGDNERPITGTEVKLRSERRIAYEDYQE